MKFGWVTPLAEASAIGRVNVAVCEELLARGHRVEIIRSEAPELLDLKAHPTSATVYRYTDVGLEHAQNEYDCLFVNIGDYYNYHAGVFKYLELPFSIGIFHDFCIYNLFCGWLEKHHSSSASIHDAEMVGIYGEQVRPLAVRARSGEADLEEIARSAPMTEWLGRRCAAAVAHSPFYMSRLENSCPGPIGVAALPWPPRRLAPGDGEPKARLILLTVGHVNTNKCVDRVIEALGSSPLLRRRIHYVVAGPIEKDMKDGLELRASELGVSFVATGAIGDDQLELRLSGSDIVCCLRKPVLEGASASAIEGMLSGKPILVADAGFYSDLPDSLVVKVSAAAEVEEIKQRLEELLHDPGRRLTIGNNAKIWAEETFSVSRYADAMLELASRRIAIDPLLSLNAKIAVELADIGLGGESSNVKRLAALIEGLTETAER